MEKLAIIYNHNKKCVQEQLQDRSDLTNNNQRIF